MAQSKKHFYNTLIFMPNYLRKSTNFKLKPKKLSFLGTFKGLSLDVGLADFSKKPPRRFLKKDLSNEPTFGRIYLAGQYL